MPRSRRKCLAQASTQAPVLPAETKASARPSATARTPTSSELSRRLTASRGSSAMSIASAAWRMAMCSGLYETPSSTFWMRRSSPTSRHSMSVASETWATPCTTASGAWSPPMASTAMVGMLGVRPGNHGERGERAGERERQAQRRPTRCGARDARRGLVAAGGRSEQPFGSAAVAALPRIVRHSRHYYPDGLLAAHQVDQVAELGEEELLHRELDRGRRAGERDDDLAARHTRHGARQHGRRAHLLVREHAEELAEAVEAFLEEARDRLVGRVARREPRAPVHDHGVQAGHAEELLEMGAEAPRVVGQDGVGEDAVPRLLEERTDAHAARVALGRARVAHRDDGAHSVPRLRLVMRMLRVGAHVSPSRAAAARSWTRTACRSADRRTRASRRRAARGGGACGSASPGGSGGSGAGSPRASRSPRARAGGAGGGHRACGDG